MKHALWFSDRTTYNQVHFCVCVGARAREIEDIRWSDVDLANERVRLRARDRTSQGSFVPLPPTVLAMLTVMKALLIGDNESSVWEDGRGTRKIPMRTRWHRLFVLWAKAHSAGKIATAPPTATPPLSALRLFAIRDALARGGAADQVAAWAGTASVDIIERTRA